MKRFASIALIFCLTTPLLAQAPPSKKVTAAPAVAVAAADAEPSKGEAKVVLVAPSNVRVGELVRLDVSESTAASYKWLLIPDSVTDFLTYDAGARAVFSARTAGEYRFIVAVGAKDGSVDVVTHVVMVAEPPREPAADASLVEWIPYWNWNLGLPQGECKALAASFEVIAANVNDLDDPQEWINATAKSNREVLGNRLNAWKPMLDKIGAVLLERAQAGSLATPEDHAKMWKEIADGLNGC
jgi:hypothetical protein